MTDRPILFSASDRAVAAAAGRLGIPAVELAAGLNREEKFCGGCRAWKPRTVDHFAPATRGFDNLRSRCRLCIIVQKREHYGKTRPAQRARQLAYQQANRERLYAYNAKWQRERHAALREEARVAYGSKCNCCGEREPIFLDLDHVYNDGAAHRKELGNGTLVMLALKAQGWPKDRYQLLCCNCNQGKARNGGVCPHVKNRS